MTRTAYIVDAVRSPMAKGKVGGALSEVHPVELLAHLLKSLASRNALDTSAVEDVIIGCVSQVGEQSATPGRMAVLAAGYSDHVPSTTIDRRCGSSQQAIHFAAQAIMAGVQDVVIAGGVESMSRIPMGSGRLGKDPFGPSATARYAPGFVSQGVAAELVAAKWGLTRDDMDAYAARSHGLADAARSAGGFDREIVAIPTEAGLVDRDETIRTGTTVEGLANLKAVFETPEFSDRFPDVDWGVTAGNSSQITDGASALLIVSEDALKRYGLTPRARLIAFDVRGDDPMLMLTAPIPSTRKVLEKAGLSVADIDHFEINEAFASVPLAWRRELGADPDKLNPVGGAIALGHPLGASGARLMTSMLNALERSGGRYGLQAMCEAGGMANATIIERL